MADTELYLSKQNNCSHSWLLQQPLASTNKGNARTKFYPAAHDLCSEVIAIDRDLIALQLQLFFLCPLINISSDGIIVGVGLDSEYKKEYITKCAQVYDASGQCIIPGNY